MPERHYSLLIEWSDRDQAYLVSLPEWGGQHHTHGNTYEEAARNGRELLDLLIADAQAEGNPLPEPRLHETVREKSQKANAPYSIVIEWSPEDQLYIASFPKWSDLSHTDGRTREEALANAQEVLDLLIASYEDEGRPLPEPQLYRGPEDED